MKARTGITDDILNLSPVNRGLTSLKRVDTTLPHVATLNRLISLTRGLKP